MTNIQIDGQFLERCRNDFKNYLYVVFKYINLPSPTDIQYAIADELVITETGYINSLYCISNKLEISGNVDTSVYAISKTFIQT